MSLEFIINVVIIVACYHLVLNGIKFVLKKLIAKLEKAAEELVDLEDCWY